MDVRTRAWRLPHEPFSELRLDAYVVCPDDVGAGDELLQ